MSGTPPTEEDKFYLAWGRESLKRNIEIANQVLQQLVTLNTALLGGSVFFLSAEFSVEFARWIVVALLLLALAVAFIGVLPYEGKIDLRIPKDIKAHKEKALRHKRFFVTVSALFTGGAFGFAIAGVAIHRFCA